jgi:hypothetical protein
MIPTGIDKCNNKIMISTIRYPNLFRVGINLALRALVLPIMMSKLNLDPEWIWISILNFLIYLLFWPDGCAWTHAKERAGRATIGPHMIFLFF